MKKVLFILFAALLLGTTSSALAQEADFTIEAFHADLTIKEDGTLLVEETISGVFLKEKHGIFRYVPVIYEINDHTDAYTTINFHSVTDALGNDVTYQTSSEGSDYVVRIGDADITVIGDYEYTIEYVVEGVFMYFDDHDELFWNVTGNDWPVSMNNNVSALVHLPPGALMTGSACYTGEFGSEASNCAVRDLGTSVEIQSDDFLTIAIGFSPNIIAEVLPRIVDEVENERLRAESLATWKAEQERKRLLSNFFWLVPLIFVLLFRFLMNLFWPTKKVKRAIVAEFKAPEGMRPTEMAVLMNGKMNKRDIAAFIVDMAVRGYLKIVEGKTVEKRWFAWRPTKIFKVIKLKGLGSEVKDWEKKLFNAIFNGEKTEATEKQIGRRISAVYLSVSSTLIVKMKKEGYIKRYPATIDGSIILIGFLLFVALVIGGMVASVELRTPVPFVSLFLTGVLIEIFRPKIIQYTVKGGETKAHIEGFKLFLSTAEKYRLEWQEKEHIFEEMLPYAMSFKIADKWSQVFDEFYIEQKIDNPIPRWVQMEDLGVANLMAMTSEIETFTKVVSTNVVTYSPSGSSYKYPGSGSSGGYSGGSGISSSSSGGSGSSGGGFGGGGGGSW